jgi:hypothetical protein
MLDHAKKFPNLHNMVNKMARTILTKEARVIVYDDNDNILDICEGDIEANKTSYGFITSKGRKPTAWFKKWMKGREDKRVYLMPVDRPQGINADR